MAFDSTPSARQAAPSAPPAWQTALYPATYQTDTSAVRSMQAKADAELALQRRCMAKALKWGDHRSVAAHRREIDKFARWSRNCATQLRLIGARA